MSLLRGFLALTCAAFGSTMNHPLPGSNDDIRKIVISQLQAERGLSADLGTVTSVPRINVQARRSPSPSLQLWDATVADLDHWHAYIVGRQGQRLFRLGGFHGPELRELATLLKPRVDDPDSLLRCARELAGLADPEGSDEILTTAPSESSGRAALALQRWRQLAPIDWPEDKVFRDERGVGVRVTILSLIKRTYAPFWVPRLFVFTFSTDGALQASATKDGKPFSSSNTGQ